jgi:hypothetical protein
MAVPEVVKSHLREIPNLPNEPGTLVGEGEHKLPRRPVRTVPPPYRADRSVQPWPHGGAQPPGRRPSKRNVRRPLASFDPSHRSRGILHTDEADQEPSR